MNDAKQAVLDALVAERYAKPTWWRLPADSMPSAPSWDDSEFMCAARRRAMAQDFRALDKKAAVS